MLGEIPSLQPNLDLFRWKIWGDLPGTVGAIVDDAVTTRADSFPALLEGPRGSRGQRQAGALTAICQDSLTGTSGEEPLSSAPLVTVFVDATLAGKTDGEAGAFIQAGIRGPEKWLIR